MPVARVLGISLALSATASTFVVAWTRPDGPVSRAGWGAFAATMLVFAAGLVDDLAPRGPRGIRGHLRALASGQVTTGIVKLVVVTLAAVVVVALRDRGGAAERVTAVVLIAACTNVWNGLDVRPGRAIKLGLVAMVGLVGAPLSQLPTLPGVAIGSIVALWPDLRERAMLGDGGANLLGFTIGLGLSSVLASWGLVTGAVLAVVVNVIGETVTISRVIDTVAPVRWFDALGRLRD